MLTTQQPVLRKFWYATVPMAQLLEGPKPFRLLGQDIVLFLGADGAPAALADRCNRCSIFPRTALRAGGAFINFMTAGTPRRCG